MKDTDIIDSHPGNISLAGRPDSLKNSLVGNFKYVGVPRPMYSGTSPEPAFTNTSSRLLTEAEAFLQVESGQFLAFD